MATKFKHGLGDRAKDRISGLRGIITSRSEHLFGCARYWISPEDNKDGKPMDGCWLDEDAVEVIEPAALTPKQYRVVDAPSPYEAGVPLRRAGGPTSQPASHARADR